MTITEKKLSYANGTLEKEYGAYVNRLLRTRYSLSEELSLLRKREETPEEFAAYNAYAEACKARAREALFGKEGEA
jgi:hypothetical protein